MTVFHGENVGFFGMGNLWATAPGSLPRATHSASSRTTPSVSVTLDVIEQA